MTNQEAKDDMEQEMKEEVYETKRINNDYDYALDKCGVNNAIESLHQAVRAMKSYGYDMNDWRELL
jgi:hypothetical protein